MNNPTKSWFITKEEGKYYCFFVVCVVRSVIEYDDVVNCLVVYMQNELNAPDSRNCKLAEFPVGDFFHTKKEAQIEIIRRERFGN